MGETYKKNEKRPSLAEAGKGQMKLKEKLDLSAYAMSDDMRRKNSRKYRTVDPSKQSTQDKLNNE